MQQLSLQSWAGDMPQVSVLRWPVFAKPAMLPPLQKQQHVTWCAWVVSPTGWHCRLQGTICRK
jgi:hypothetical protein